MMAHNCRHIQLKKHMQVNYKHVQLKYKHVQLKYKIINYLS